MRFAVCGEALFDVFATAHTPTGITLDARLGGSPFNVAVGLQRLGQQAALVTPLSTGFLGQRLSQALQEEGVDLSLAPATSKPTTLSLVGLDPTGLPSYAFYGQGCADRVLGPAILDRWPDDVDAIHLGSYAAVVGKTADTLRQLVERQRSRSLIAYDPNVRLNMQPSVKVWREQLQWMLQHAHLVKVSEEDLELLYPGQPWQTWVAQAAQSGVGLVVVTRGEKGAYARAGTVTAQVPPEPVQVVDTVGAGDTFQAAVLTWLAEHGHLSARGLAGLQAQGLQQMLGFAARAAALTCGRRGADLPRRHELVQAPISGA
ncbi:MAG: carbohydrate kinase [Betaproteobacteria bacterium]|nr:carbohydrate kinase [Betaproteobacteria bacterium]